MKLAITYPTNRPNRGNVEAKARRVDGDRFAEVLSSVPGLAALAGEAVKA